MTGKSPSLRPSSVAAAAPASRRMGLFAGGLIVLALLAAYHNSLRVPFVFDDTPSIVDNPTIRRLWPLTTVLAPPGGGITVTGRPVLNLTLALNYAMSGTAVGSYHVVNVCIHALAGWILFGVLWRTLRQPRLRDRYGADAVPLALTVALLWALHPLQTESVTYVVQRAESLAGLFLLLTLYSFIRGVASRQPGRWFAVAVGCCLLGMATKEVMVVAPLLVLLYDGTFVAGSLKEAWHNRRRFYAGLAGTWLLLALLMVCSDQRGGTAGTALGVTPWQSLLTQCYAIVLYLKLALWPHPLVFDYGSWLAPDAWAVAPQAMLLCLLGAGTVLALRRRPALGFLGAWFFISLSPSSSVVPVVTQTLAEHRMYLPLAAVITLAVLVLHARLGRPSLLLGLAAAAGLGMLTARRNTDYHSTLALWTDTVAKRPGNHRAQYSLSYALILRGKIGEAEVHCREALRLRPNSAEAHNILALVLVTQGRVEEAMVHSREALRLKPDYAEAHNNLGIALKNQGQLEEAIVHYRETLRLKPGYPEAHNNFGNALYAQGKLEEAVEHYREALRLKPDYADAHRNLGLGLAARGQFAEAIHHYTEALRLAPPAMEVDRNLAAARFQLGLLLMQQRDVAGAVSQWREAVRWDPMGVNSLNSMAWVLATTTEATLRHGAEAVRLGEQAAQLTHRQNPAILDTLAAAYAETGRFEEAVATAQAALALAERAGNEPLAQKIRAHLETCRAGRPIRE